MPTPRQHAFAEKVALISDGANPIGRAVAMQLALYGCYVVVGFHEITVEDKLALEELKALGTLADAVEAEISTTEGSKKLVAAVENLYGRIDLLVNCCVSKWDSEFETTDEEAFDQIINANLKAGFFVTQEGVRLMKARPKPKIVNVFAACDTEYARKNVMYGAVNSAIKGLTRSLVNTLPENFRVNGVEVGETEKAEPEDLDAELFRTNSGIDADAAARTIVFLLSSEATGVNGQILKVG